MTAWTAASRARDRAGRRYLEADARSPDLALGPDEPLSQRRFRGEERGRYFFARQAGHVAQRQRHPDLRCQRRVTAGEDQPQAVIFHRRLIRISGYRLRGGGLDQRGQATFRYVLAGPELVDGLAPGGNRQPGARFGRHAVARPRPGGSDERLGYRILGGLQVTEPPGDRGHDRRPLLTVGAFKRGRRDLRLVYFRPACHPAPSTTGRTSTRP